MLPAGERRLLAVPFRKARHEQLAAACATLDGRWPAPAGAAQLGLGAAVRLRRDERRLVAASGVTSDLLSGKRIDVRRIDGRLTLPCGEEVVLGRSCRVDASGPPASKAAKSLCR